MLCVHCFDMQEEDIVGWGFVATQVKASGNKNRMSPSRGLDGA